MTSSRSMSGAHALQDGEAETLRVALTQQLVAAVAVRSIVSPASKHVIAAASRADMALAVCLIENEVYRPPLRQGRLPACGEDGEFVPAEVDFSPTRACRHQAHCLRALPLRGSPKIRQCEITPVPKPRKRRKTGRVRVAAFDGENADSLNGRQRRPRSWPARPWGELAYQLAGTAGFERVRRSNEAIGAPGSETLCELFGSEPIWTLMRPRRAIISGTSHRVHRSGCSRWRSNCAASKDLVRPYRPLAQQLEAFRTRPAPKDARADWRPSPSNWHRR